MLLDCMDLLLRFVHEIDVVIPSFPGFYPNQWGSTLSTIQGFEQSHLDAILVTVVIRVLEQKWICKHKGLIHNTTLRRAS